MKNRPSALDRRQFVALAGPAALAAATAANITPAQAASPVNLRIGYQYGLVYAPILLMKEMDLVKRYVPDATVEFMRVASGAVVRDQIIAKQLDVGVLGPPPFQIGWQHLNWKYLAGTGVFPYKLVTWREDIKSIKDFKPEDKIAVPGPGSLQHILLAMAAEKQFGDARALDRNLISLPHPDATAAMLSKNPSVAAHFANIPFLFMELDEPFIHEVLDGFDAFGGRFMSPLALAGTEFIEQNPLSVAVFAAAYNEAVTIINLKPKEAAEKLAPSFKQEPATMLRWLTWPGQTFTSLPYGIMGWHNFMLQAGYVKKEPEVIADICSGQLLAYIGLEGGDGKNPVQKLQERG